MAKQSLGLGSSANDGTGDTLRAGGDKINDNFDEIYNALGNGSTLTDIINSSGEVDVASGENKLVFLYSAESDLPSASTYHGAVAHVHATGALYYAHGGAWRKVMTDVSGGPVANYTAPGPQLVYTTTGSTTSSAYYLVAPVPALVQTLRLLFTGGIHTSSTTRQTTALTPCRSGFQMVVRHLPKA